ncbi:hypothetical protein B005_1070 [Nocardiopsis alba ATCC BAA-2165]|uniref:Uncharacterized protein n=1 Tax=Nocardiopsis alba (strain ATCC BAA-2165 / BE74) TaxID=1205910 RepID=J7L1U1_NOCAA|nr:hypothetical protein B005_1070 [Nocardiopsis alba ATCC BAA-2165]
MPFPFLGVPRVRAAPRCRRRSTCVSRIRGRGPGSCDSCPCDLRDVNHSSPIISEVGPCMCARRQSDRHR